MQPADIAASCLVSCASGCGARKTKHTHKDAVRFDAVEAYRRNGRSITDRESATRVAMGDDMMAKGSCIVGQKVLER